MTCLKKLFRIKYLCFLALSMFSVGCDNGTDEIRKAPVKTTDITINPGTTYQTIVGFGGANRMWGTQFLKPAEAKIAFGMDDTDLGLSIFRVRIASNPDEWPLIVESAREAQKYNAKILASPWSPPPALKSNGSDVGGICRKRTMRHLPNI